MVYAVRKVKKVCINMYMMKIRLLLEWIVTEITF